MKVINIITGVGLKWLGLLLLGVTIFQNGCNSSGSGGSISSNDSSCTTNTQCSGGQVCQNGICVGINGSTGTVELSIISINAKTTSGLSGLQYPQASTGRLNTLSISRTIDPSTYRAQTIVSGPPDAMKIYIQSISADGDNGKVTIFQSTNPNGTEVNLTSGSVNLAASGITTQAIPVGDYHQIDINIARVGQFKGCVSGTFNANTSYTGLIGGPLHTCCSITDPAYAGYAGLIFTSENMAAGTYTFCTIANRSEVSVYTYTSDTIGSNADFEANTTPEFVAVDLQGANFDNKTPAEIQAASLGFTFPVTFTVVAGTITSTTLTLAIDLNRMLRYYANTRNDFNPPNPNMKTGTSYFFTTIFGWSVFVFANYNGSIEGYQIDAEIPAGSPPPLNNTQAYIIKTWMTLIKDGAGNPIAGVISPNDDNAPWVVKGPIVASSVTPGTISGTVNIPAYSGGEIINFTYKNIGDSEDSCTVQAPSNWGEYNIFYTRKL